MLVNRSRFDVKTTRSYVFFTEIIFFLHQSKASSLPAYTCCFMVCLRLRCITPVIMFTLQPYRFVSLGIAGNNRRYLHTQPIHTDSYTVWLCLCPIDLLLQMGLVGLKYLRLNSGVPQILYTHSLTLRATQQPPTNPLFYTTGAKTKS